MAGSWKHMTTKSGELRSNESFCDMVENLGDAYETAEECFGMVHWLANLYADAHGGDPSYWVERAREHYQAGLNLGGVQEEGAKIARLAGSDRVEAINRYVREELPE